MRRWLIDVPAAIVTIWFLLYRCLLLGITIVTVSGVMALLLLAALGLH